MKKLILALGTVVALASCGGSTATVENKGDKKDSTGVTAPAETQVEAVTYKVDAAGSELKWAGTKKIGGGHNGTVAVKEGSFDVKGTEVVGGSIVIDLNSIVALDQEGEWKTKLEGHLKAPDFFDVAQFPTATIKVTGVEAGNVKADLTIKDKTAEVQFPATVTVDDNGAAVAAKLTIDRTKWGLVYGSGNFFKELAQDNIINDNIDFEISLKGNK